MQIIGILVSDDYSDACILVRVDLTVAGHAQVAFKNCAWITNCI